MCSLGGCGWLYRNGSPQKGRIDRILGRNVHSAGYPTGPQVLIATTSPRCISASVKTMEPTNLLMRSIRWSSPVFRGSQRTGSYLRPTRTAQFGRSRTASVRALPCPMKRGMSSSITAISSSRKASPAENPKGNRRCAVPPASKQKYPPSRPMGRLSLIQRL